MTVPAGATPRRILFVRLSALGDLVFASPLIASARRAYPHAHLAWLVQPEWASVLAHHPDLDQVIEWPLPRWRRLWGQRRWVALVGDVIAAVRRLREQRFDLALDLQGLLKSALPVRCSGAPVRVGLGSREASRFLMTQVVSRGPDSDRISSEYRHLAGSLGWPVEGFQLQLYPGREAEARAEALLAQHGLGDGYAVLCPFTTRPQKHWIDARWRRLAVRLSAELGLTSVLLGGPGDRDAARAIAGSGTETIIDLVGATTLLDAAAVIRRARLVVGVDTGLSHMGIAFQRPTVLLFGSTCPYTETGAAPARVLYHRLSCSPCRRRPTCNGAFTCMREIDVDEVVAVAAGLTRTVA